MMTAEAGTLVRLCLEVVVGVEQRWGGKMVGWRGICHAWVSVILEPVSWGGQDKTLNLRTRKDVMPERRHFIRISLPLIFFK